MIKWTTILVVLSVATSVSAFLPRLSSPLAAHTTSSSLAATAGSSNKILVVSPPGGVGEVAAVSAAKLGSSVRWFVVSGAQSFQSVQLSPQAFQQISDASGSLELAGATVEDLKAGGDSLALVSTWCGAGDGMVCTYDGCGDNLEFQAALRLATQQAAIGVTGPQVAVLGAEEDLEEDAEENSNGGFLSGIFSNALKIPSTLPKSLKRATTVRHGQLFGIPESSPNFSPLVGGPRRDPTIAEEYTMRNVRVDPFVYSGNIMASKSLMTCRHAVGEAAALVAASRLPNLSEPISISSQTGTDKWTMEQWTEEFSRVQELVSSGKASTLFSQPMVVPDTERLADWLATKWAPAVMRTYDIAAIRKGARPVYATKKDGGQVEITWQKLVDFDTVIAGKMLLQVSEDGISATREAGDTSKGFGTVSRKPLPGEDVLVRRLAEAASQAIDKGLAKKIPSKKPVKEVVEVAPVSSLQEAGTVQSAAVAVEEQPPVPATPATGPRKAGARRSTPRKRRGSSANKQS